MLRIESERQRCGVAAEIIGNAVERAAAEAEQAAEHAAGNQRLGQLLRAVNVFQTNGQTRRVGERWLCGELRNLGAGHQLLAVTDINVVGTVRIGRCRHPHQFVQFEHELVALVEQVVWRLIDRRTGDDDAVVEFGDLLGIRIDGRDRRRNLAVDAGVHLADAVFQTLVACDKRLRRRNHRLPRRQLRRIGGDLLHPSEKILQGWRHAGIRIGQHVVDLLDLRVIRIELAARRLRAIDLPAQELVVHAFDGRDVRALPDEASAGQHRHVRRLDRALTVEAWRVGVGDVVLGRQQPKLRNLQAGKAGTDDAGGHGRSSRF